MKIKILILALAILLTAYPSTTFASWWNPFTWRASRPIESNKIDTTLATSSVEISYAQPTVEELLKRIAELEDKLDKARSQINAATTKIEVAVAPKTEVVSVGLSDSQILAKVKSSIVSVESATSSGSGVIIDAQGHIIVEAHTVWSLDQTNAVAGVADKVTVTFSSGSKKSANVIGIDESLDIAVLQLSEKSASSYLKINHDSGIQIGDKAYVLGLSGSKDASSGGSSFVSGTVSQKKTGVVEITSVAKPLDNGGAMVNANGDFVGITNKSTCKVLEEMKNCLKYTITADIFRTQLPKLLAGMKLYRDKKNSTKEEELVRGQLDGIFLNTKDGAVIQYAIYNVSGNNSFDYFNSKLPGEKEFKITKLYLNKLKGAAENIEGAFNFLKEQAYTLHLFIINEAGAIATLDDYQKKILNQMNVFNETKLKEYQTKVAMWSTKKKEYDTLMSTPANATHDFLMEQGVFIESEIDILKSEQGKILDMFSGENLEIF